MNVLVGVISYAAAWVMPRRFVDRIRDEFPQHTIVDTWDFDGIRRHIPNADAAFIPHITPDMLASARRLRWIQSPAVGVGNEHHLEVVAVVRPEQPLARPVGGDLRFDHFGSRHGKALGKPAPLRLGDVAHD